MLEVKKMEHQRTLLSEIIEYETILDESENNKGEFQNDNDEPLDLADQAYEEWRDKVRPWSHQGELKK